MEKLELKHLAPYLPYALNGIETKKGTIKELLSIDLVSGFRVGDLKEDYFVAMVHFKPILRPLSDLMKEEFIMDEWRKKAILFLDETANSPSNSRQSHIGSIMYGDLLKLLEWHFDVFGLIPKDLAIDINSLK